MDPNPVTAADQYAWLEDVEGDDALAWVRARNDEATAALTGPGFDDLREGILAVLDSDAKIPAVAKAGELYYNVWRDAAHERGLWRRTTLASYRTDDPVGERVTARQALEFATVEGARANGLVDRVGTLEPGKQADIVLIRTDHLNTWPVNDPVGAVVNGADTRNVDSVFVAGTAVKRDGRLLRGDLGAIKEKVLASLAHLHESVPALVPAQS